MFHQALLVVEMGYLYAELVSKNFIHISKFGNAGGGSGIRTLGTLSRPPVFKTGAFDHSAKPPLHSCPNRSRLIRQTTKCILPVLSKPLGKIADLGAAVFSGAALQVNVPTRSS